MSIQKRAVRGKLKYIVRYTDEQGESRSKSFDKQRLARSWEAEYIRQKETGAWANPDAVKVTVKSSCEARARSATRPNTEAVRRQLVQNLGPLGRKKVGEVRRVHVQEWTNTLRDGRPWASGDPLGDRSVKSLYGQLSAMFSEFVDDGSLVRNPCSGVKVASPAASVADEDIPTVGEVQSLATKAEELYGRSLRLMFLTMSQAGLRPSEACGLQVIDVDVKRLVIKVRRQMGKDRSRATAETKSVSAVRVVPISRSLADELMPVLEDRLGGEYVFVRDGRRTRLRDEPWIGSAVSNAFPYVRRSLGLSERFSAHTFRHFYASSLIHRGVNVAAVSRVLGHADVATTLRIYVHIMPGADDLVREASSKIMWDENGIPAY